MPQLGRTQYFLGAVVLILNATFLSAGFFRLMCDVTACVNGPKKEKIINHFINCKSEVNKRHERGEKKLRKVRATHNKSAVFK
jgi:hypothetical protein